MGGGIREPGQKIGWIQRLTSRNRLFIAGIFIFSAVAHVPYLAPGGPSACYPNPLFLVIDEGTVLYDSFRITCGEVMYRDFFQFQGPIFYYIHAGLFAITGPSITTARTLNLLVTGITAVFIALIITRRLGHIAGAIAAAIHACLLVPIYPYAYPHWFAECFALAGIYLLATSKCKSRRDLAGGIFLGLSSFTIQSLGLPILAACIITLAIPGIIQSRWKEICNRLLWVLGGALLIIFPFILYLGFAGGLDQMWYSMVKWVFNLYSEGQKDAAIQGYGANLYKYLILHSRSGISQPWRILAMTGLYFIKFFPL